MESNCRERNKCDEKVKFIMAIVENIEGKRYNGGYQYVLLFSQCFQKASPIAMGEYKHYLKYLYFV